MATNKKLPLAVAKQRNKNEPLEMRVAWHGMPTLLAHVAIVELIQKQDHSQFKAGFDSTLKTIQGSSKRDTSEFQSFPKQPPNLLTKRFVQQLSSDKTALIVGIFSKSEEDYNEFDFKKYLEIYLKDLKVLLPENISYKNYEEIADFLFGTVGHENTEVWLSKPTRRNVVDIIFNKGLGLKRQSKILSSERRC